MFFIFDREKIASYIILLSTVIILFAVAFNIGSGDSITTSANTIQHNSSIDTNIVYTEYND